MAIDKFKDYSIEKFPDYEKRFREKLEKAGLQPIQIEIFVLRFVYDCSFSEIAKELSINGTLTVVRLYEEASKTLKKVGFDE
jgi:DNA-directed RNA polymerase specialized sigma24 family protein